MKPSTLNKLYIAWCGTIFALSIISIFLFGVPEKDEIGAFQEMSQQIIAQHQNENITINYKVAKNAFSRASHSEVEFSNYQFIVIVLSLITFIFSIVVYKKNVKSNET